MHELCRRHESLLVPVGRGGRVLASVYSYRRAGACTFGWGSGVARHGRQRVPNCAAAAVALCWSSG